MALLAGIVFGLRYAFWMRNPPEVPAMPAMADPSTKPPPGATSSAVQISPARQQLIGVRTGLVERQRVGGTMRTVGVLAYDETRVTHIHVRVAGWVEQLFINYVGKPVRRGQPLFSVYSPDLVTAENDYLIALRARDQSSSLAIPQARASAEALVNASRDRLRRWNVTDAEISALERSGKASRTVTLVSPFDGTVLERNTFAGQYVTPDMDTFKIADLSRLWAIGQVFEYEAASMHVGDQVDIEFPYGQAARAIEARIDFVFPDIDPQTRKVRFRAMLPNADQRLKPETYVTLVLHTEAVDRLVVPKEAVIDTGARKYALLALPDGYFDPRDVDVGPPLGEVYPVISGLTEGDRVVTSAQFLVDSETNLASAMQSMSMSGMSMSDTKPATSARTGSPAPSMPGMPMQPTTGGGSEAPSMPGMLMPPAQDSTPALRDKRAPAAPPRTTPAPVPRRPAMPAMPEMNMPAPQKSAVPEHSHSGM